MLPDDVTEEDQDQALVFGSDLSVHPESIRGRELREERLRSMIDLTPYPILRYHAAGTRPERDAAREECCRRYGREEIDTGRMYRFIRDELEELVKRNCSPVT